MQEILFRGRSLDDGKWAYGFYSHELGDFDNVARDWIEGLGGCHTSLDLVDRNTVGQYIGLKDRNKKKIFEGDIIRYTGGDYPEICVIRYDAWAARFMFCGSAVCDFDNCDSELETEVIGNIYDNPELIEN